MASATYAIQSKKKKIPKKTIQKQKVLDLLTRSQYTFLTSYQNSHVYCGKGMQHKGSILLLEDAVF